MIVFAVAQKFSYILCYRLILMLKIADEPRMMTNTLQFLVLVS